MQVHAVFAQLFAVVGIMRESHIDTGSHAATTQYINSARAMMQPIRISAVASTHRCTSHPHRYGSSDILAIEGNAIRHWN